MIGNESAESRTRRQIGWFRALVLVALLYGAAWGYDALVGAPWAYSLGGRPTLTGAWKGRIDAATDPGGSVHLEIERGSARSSPNGRAVRPTYRIFDYTRLGAHATLHGTATWCRGDGSASHYWLTGWATHDGDVTVTFDVTTPPSRSAQELRETRGHWDGVGTLTLAGPMRLYVVEPGRPTTTHASTTATGMILHHADREAPDTTCVGHGAG